MIKTRFAPSPTGSLHIGGVRTALFSWLYARKHNGKFILRIEDTDRERSSDAAVKIILDSIEWLGLTYDEGPYYQTQRFDRYNEVIQILIENGLAYRCNCSKKRLEELRATQISLNHKPKYDGKSPKTPMSNFKQWLCQEKGLENLLEASKILELNNVAHKIQIGGELNDKRFKRVVMDYMDISSINFYKMSSKYI